jgi:hypothetical protein
MYLFDFFIFYYLDKSVRTPVFGKCPVENIPKKQELLKNNVVLVKIRCSDISSKSKFCTSKESYVKYICKNGFIFRTLESMIYLINHHIIINAN